MKEGSTTIANFEYDGGGRRTEKVAAGLTHQYIYDVEGIVEERISGSSSDTIRYYHGIGIDEPLARENASSFVQETGSSGAVTLDREYDPSGELLQSSTTSGYAFTGREWDSETAMYYYRARYYAPSSGRFVSNDPVGLGPGTNFYRYVDNGPSRFVDPSGLCSSDPDQGAPPGGGSPSNKQKNCLQQMLDGESIDGIKFEEKGPSEKWAATTRKEKIIIYGTNNFRGTANLTGATTTITLKAKDASGNETTEQYEVDASGSTTNYTYDANGNIPRNGPRFDTVAEKLGWTAEALRRWVRHAERDHGKRPGLTTDERELDPRLRGDDNIDALG